MLITNVHKINFCSHSAKAKDKPDKPEKPAKPEKPEKPAKLEKPSKPEKPEKQDKRKSQVTPLVVIPLPATTTAVPTPAVTTPTTARTAYEPPSSSGRDADDFGTNYTVQVFVNHACSPGPYLSPAKVAGLPSCFRGTVLNVARDCFQSIVNAGLEPVTVFGILKPGNGKTKITVKNGKQTSSCFLQTIDRVSRFWCVLDKLAENLQCCENLFSGERIAGPCSKCGRSGEYRGTVASSGIQEGCGSPSPRSPIFFSTLKHFSIHTQPPTPPRTPSNKQAWIRC